MTKFKTKKERVGALRRLSPFWFYGSTRLVAIAPNFLWRKKFYSRGYHR